MNQKAQKILDATIRLFLRDGVKKVTMDEIAESAAASKVTVYKYFTDKDGLLLAVGGYVLSDYAAQLHGVTAAQLPTAAKFYAALDVLSDFSDSGNYTLCHELAALIPAMDAALLFYQAAYRNALYALIDEGMAAGYMKPGPDREMIFYYIDMGVRYYQQNEAYRLKMRGDSAFRTQYMQFFTGNIFADGAAVLPEE